MVLPWVSVWLLPKVRVWDRMTSLGMAIVTALPSGSSLALATVKGSLRRRSLKWHVSDQAA